MELNKNSNELKQNQVRKNIFGLLSLFIFLVFLCLSTIAFAFGKMGFNTQGLHSVATVGYGLSIVSQIIAIVICKKDPSIDREAAGIDSGYAAAGFSFLMIVLRLAKMI